MEVCLGSPEKEKVLKDIQNLITEVVKIIDELERKNTDKFMKVHPQPPPAGDIAIDQISAKKFKLSTEEHINNFINPSR